MHERTAVPLGALGRMLLYSMVAVIASGGVITTDRTTASDRDADTDTYAERMPLRRTSRLQRVQEAEVSDSRVVSWVLTVFHRIPI